VPEDTDSDRTPSGPRPFWSGTLTFGLVSVPVRLYSAVRSSGSSLRMVDANGTPLSRRYYCPEEDREVDRDELVRGYELDDGDFVILSEEELEALEPQKSREIDLRRFVPVDDLDPVFFERAYVLTPGDGSAKAYRLLAETMQRTGRAGLATFVMRTKEYMVAILAEGGILRAETMRFHDEIRSAEGVGLPERREAARSRTRAMASAIEDATRESLDRDELEDEGTEALEALVKRKLSKGDGVRDVPALQEGGEAEPGRIIDLLEVLRRSLAESEGDDDARRGDGAGGDGAAADLSELTKAELYERAQELDVPGRSSMTKKDLVRAVRHARSV
jgi:DNA end-binding protein Ku